MRTLVSSMETGVRRTVLAELILVALASEAHAANINVPCSGAGGGTAGLISAITTANATSGDTITLAAGCTYTLSAVDNFWYGPNGLPPISSSMTIVGNGAKIVRSSVASTPIFRFFYVSGGLSGLPAGSLGLQDLTLTGGVQQGGHSEEHKR